MSVHLVGGGRELELAPVVYGGFVSEARAHGRAAGRERPRIGVVVLAPQEDQAAAVDWFAAAMARCGDVDVLAATATEEEDEGLRSTDGSPVADRWFADLDGLLVGGGLTPAYHRVLQPYATTIRSAVRDGLPYAGFSAGAALAATRALLGGWRVHGIPVTHEDNAEDLDEVTVVGGLGLVPGTVEVHAAQWGTLSRLVAAIEIGATTSGMAIDENTVVIVDPTSDSSPAADVQVSGVGQAWLLTVAGGSVEVERRPAG